MGEPDDEVGQTCMSVNNCNVAGGRLKITVCLLQVMQC